MTARKFMYALITAVVVAISAASLAGGVSGELQNGIVRLHIIADSDTQKAQEVKLKVRDAVLAGVSFEDEDFLEKAKAAAERVLEENGEQYGARAEYGRFYFPRKSYGGVTLPAGEYYGVRIILGSGGGRNWWCVMYPPLCAVNEEELKFAENSEKILGRTLSPGSYELITSDGDKIKIRFKTVEIIQAAMEWLK